MVFKRRDRRPIWRTVAEFVWPRGGWLRAFYYASHRLRRLPDTPEKIARGVWAGVFVCFSPLFGLHFLYAYLVAKLMRGNILAALLSTFFGNLFTFPPIAAISLQLGHWMLGRRYQERETEGLFKQFKGAFGDLTHNFKAIFTPEKADWHRLAEFYESVFFPYFVGGIIPGIIAATICYYLAVPLIAAYQNRRKKSLQKRLRQLKQPEDAS